MGNDVYYDKWMSGLEEFENLVRTMMEDITITEDQQLIPSVVPVGPKTLSKDIFIVHGHNEEMKQTVARLVTNLNLSPIILHEQANKGKTIIEKLISNASDLSCAIVLLSGDDYGYMKNNSVEDKKLRARQNVILELGFFIGLIGREHVFVLYEVAKDFEIPSDYHGVIYIPYDLQGAWKLELVKELKACGFTIDANMLFNK